MAAGTRQSIDNFCRLCAIESQSGVIIYSSEGQKMCLEEKIFTCLRIEVSRNDMLPKRVCQSCNLLLEDYYRFSERATEVQQTLYFLLGHHPHPQEQQMCLIEDRVKVESNLIKKELDEFIVQQGSVQMDAERFDVQIPTNPNIFYYEDRVGERNYGLVQDSIEVPDDVKQLHRRKMLTPEKMVHDQVEVVGLENFEYSMGDVQDEYKTQNFVEECIIEDVCEEVEETYEEKEENKKLEMEWGKKWGIMCFQCRNLFPDRSSFDKHYKYSYNQKPVYTCSFCKKSRNKYSSYQRHVLVHIKKGKFRCRFCEKKFCSKEMLEIHYTTLHSHKKIFICECGITFMSKRTLEFHMKKHTKNTNEEFRCTECGKMLKTRGGLAAHESVHKLGRHFMCHICGKTFTQKINMQQHVKHHKGERPYSCEICKKSFVEKSHLNRHKSFHTKDRPFQCPVCNKMYKTERCLKVHSQTHWNRRPYVCSVCGKGFLSSTKLKQHYNCHTGERPFACKYCERTFTNYPNWLKHTRRKHKVDHKTGLSLKEEHPQPEPALDVNQICDAVDTSEPTIELIEIPDVEIKEDGRDSVQSHHSVLSMINPMIMTKPQFHVSPDEEGRYQMNLIPDLVSSQVVYSDRMIVHQEMLL